MHVHLTAAGHVAFEQQGRAIEHGESSLCAALTADEKQVLAGLFRELVLALETEHVPHDRRPIVTARSLPSPPE